MKKRISKLMVGLLSFVLVLAIGISGLFGYCLKGAYNAFADEPSVEAAEDENCDYEKKVYYIDELYEREIREVTQEEKEQLYGCVCEVERQVDVVEELERAKEEIGLLGQNDNLYGADFYIDSINSAIDDYNEYRPYLEDLLYTDFESYNSYSFINWFKKMFYKVVTAVGVVALRVINWDLSAELLSYARNNTYLDSVYYPVHISKISDSQTFNNIIYNDKKNGTEKFEKETDGDDLFFLCIISNIINPNIIRLLKYATGTISTRMHNTEAISATLQIISE